MRSRLVARVGRAGLVAGAVLLSACGGQAVSGVQAGTGPAALPSPDEFVASYAYGSGDVGGGHGTFLAVFDERTGQHLRDLVHLEEGSPLQLAGFFRGADGSVTYALARGPQFTSNVSNGAPRPGSCGGTVYRIDADSGGTRSLFTVDVEHTVSSPAVSPDGRSVAYVSQSCTAAFAQQVVVRDLASGAERHIWVPGLSATGVAWRSDGARLLFTVMFPVSPTVGLAGYVVVPADADGPQPPSAVRLAPDEGCTVVSSAVFTSAGVQLAEGCPDPTTGTATLVQFDGDGSGVVWRSDTGLCPNGMTLRNDPSGGVLVTSTEVCRSGVPVDIVQAWDGRTSQQIGRYPNPEQFVSAAT